MEEWFGLIKWVIAVFALVGLLYFYSSTTYGSGRELGDILKAAISGGETCTIGPYSGKTRDYFHTELMNVQEGKNWAEILALFRGLNQCFGIDANYFTIGEASTTAQGSWLQGDEITPLQIVKHSARLHLSKPLAADASLAQAQTYVNMGQQFSAALSSEDLGVLLENVEKAKIYLVCRSKLSEVETELAKNTIEGSALAYVHNMLIPYIENGRCPYYLSEVYPPVQQELNKRAADVDTMGPFYETVESYACQLQAVASPVERAMYESAITSENAISCR